jgi:HlyD family type I secretion membrane fusion protein
MQRAQIARARQVMVETRLRVNSARTARLDEVMERLRAVQAERYDLEERLAAGGDVLRRTRIRAPIAGTVVGLGVHTAGGVLSPGEAVMDIVPSAGRLVVETRIDPKDIDVVRGGLAAKVRFTAFDQRATPPADGVIASVSADRLTDQATGEKYYLARVEVGDGELARALRPGMAAEVMIVTERRTLMGYLVEPLTKSLNRAFRES